MNWIRPLAQETLARTRVSRESPNNHGTEMRDEISVEVGARTSLGSFSAVCGSKVNRKKMTLTRTLSQLHCVGSASPDHTKGHFLPPGL